MTISGNKKGCYCVNSKFTEEKVYLVVNDGDYKEEKLCQKKQKNLH